MLGSVKGQLINQFFLTAKPSHYVIFRGKLPIPAYSNLPEAGDETAYNQRHELFLIFVTIIFTTLIILSPNTPDRGMIS